MKAALLLLFTFLASQQMPKNNPNGVWESQSGTQYELQLSGSDLKVRLVPGSNPKYVKYEVDLKNQEEVNTYKGKGFFIAKVKDDKECRYETQWQLTIVSPTFIIGGTTNIVPDPDTCGIKEQSEVQTQLKKK
jgi:hypothetical protein